jgi:hypothetical protein
LLDQSGERMRFSFISLQALAVSAFTLCCITFAAAAATPRAVTQAQSATTLSWSADFPHAVATLRMSTPDGSIVERSFGAGPVALSLNLANLASGSYTVEVTFVSSAPAPREAVRGTPLVAQTTASFLIQEGVLYSATSNPQLREDTSKRTAVKTDSAGIASNNLRPNAKDQVVADDQIVHSRTQSLLETNRIALTVSRFASARRSAMLCDIIAAFQS